ncbi:hypothetical protein EAO71_14965 [Streptomyces sp. ms191]|nr:hypothetical protein EAO71_14965 [Streptomyces sp. ms191]
MRSHSGTRTGNRYDDRMVSHDVSEQTPGTRLPASVADAPFASAFLGVFGGGAARLHVDLCRVAGATCTSRAAL